MANEITVRLKCTREEVCRILENKGFRMVDRYLLEDTYFVLRKLDRMGLSVRELLKHAVLLRSITTYDCNTFESSHSVVKMTYKSKDIASNGDILSQKKVNCEIKDWEQGRCFIEAIGYEEIMCIRENDYVYGRGGPEIAVKDIEGGDNLIEIETMEDNEEFNTTDKLKQKLMALHLPIDESDFFVKKAEERLKNILGMEQVMG